MDFEIDGLILWDRRKNKVKIIKIEAKQAFNNNI